MQVQYTVKYTVYQSAGRCDQGVVAVVVPAQSSFLCCVYFHWCQVLGVCSLSLITLSEKLRHVADLLFYINLIFYIKSTAAAVMES